MHCIGQGACTCAHWSEEFSVESADMLRHVLCIGFDQQLSVIYLKNWSGKEAIICEPVFYFSIPSWITQHGLDIEEGSWGLKVSSDNINDEYFRLIQIQNFKYPWPNPSMLLTRNFKSMFSVPPETIAIQKKNLRRFRHTST